MVRRTPPGAEMPFLDHLEELRWRILWALGALVIGTIIGFVLVRYFDLVGVLSRPAQPYLRNGKLQLLSPADSFTIVITISVWTGVVLASPVILYQLWAFVSPALYANERRVGGYVLAGGLVLFCMGVALSYFFVLPATMKFFSIIGGPSLEAGYTARDYFSMVVTMALTFGAAFELPIVIVALTALGLVTPPFLRKYRRHALVLCAIGASLITPGDAITATVALLAPLYLLYELGIFLSRGVYRWRERRGAEDHSIGGAAEMRGSA
jgi:sec-independent protein translocase protein TatC